MTATATPYAPLRLPDSMERADIGPYMRGLREHYGLSQQDVAERLHIRIRYVQAIEAGQFEAMPGKAYAKGYVNTYAEFLGIDAKQVVERVFGLELAREQQQHTPPPLVRRETKRRRLPWGWIGGAVVLAVLLYVVAPGGAHKTQGTQTATAPSPAEEVPESIVASLRTAPMPTPQNIDCLEAREELGCFYDTRLTRRWVMPEIAPDTAPYSTKAIPANPDHD